MTRLRDFLIVLVLGSGVIWALITFGSHVHSASVSMSPIVRQAETACILDGVSCHVGSENFDSEAEAQAYLESPEHLNSLQKEKDDAEQAKKDKELTIEAEEFARQGIKKVRTACFKDGTLNCDLIDSSTVVAISELILRDRQRVATLHSSK